MRRVIVIAYVLLTSGMLFYLSHSQAPDEVKRIDIPFYVLFFMVSVFIASSERLTIRQKAAALAGTIVVVTIIGTLLYSSVIAADNRRDPITWIFATAAYGFESLLFISMVLLVDRACGWLGKHLHRAT
jgi:uncharacterized membrane protein YcfT